MARASFGKALDMEKSMVKEWVKLPEPSTIQMQPSCVAGDELPAGPVDAGRGDVWDREEVWDCVDVDEPQVPNPDWQPVPQ